MSDVRCPVDIPFADVQGNILTGYGRQGFPFARFGLIHVADPAAGRAFIEAIRDRVTTAARWPSKRKQNLPEGRVTVERPLVTLNLAFTFRGLLALGVPTRTLKGMPDEFVDGMAARAAILGDDTKENPKSGWDQIWLESGKPGKTVHILVMLNAQMQADGTPVPELGAMCDEIAGLCGKSGKLALLSGHRGPETHWQHLEAIRDTQGLPCAKEHFGYTDGISDPVFQGQYAQAQENVRARGFGASDGAGNWRPLAAGEFLLGWPDEAQEIPGSAMPLDFSRNGTFFAYRKLHQDIDGFYAWVDKTAAALKKIWKLDYTPNEAKETLLAKMAGRWSDGVPLIAAPTYKDWEDFNRRWPPTGRHEVRNDSERETKLVDFLFRDDPDGIACPMTSHIRRANTRDMLDPRGDGDIKSRMGSALNNRRRIIRRGLPYGKAEDEDHGVVMLVVCASLQRQFEFVQQQWINYGLDSNAGNDPCPVIGNHGEDAKFTIAADPKSENPPFICTGLKQWVETRGGDYFFMPSMTALRMIGMGVVDPT